jgi:MFS family permease
MLADWMGRKPLMALSGLTFVVSIPIIALSHGYGPLFFGRLLQGISGGFIGVVVPLYLAECLVASNRGKGTGIFQWLLTLGIVAAAVIGIYYSYRVEAVARAASAAALFAFKDQAWRRIFWVSLPPGILFVIGSLLVAESPRWLFRRGRKEAALASLLRSRSAGQAQVELQEMEDVAAAEKHDTSLGERVKDSLLRRKYVIPFLLACIILFCNTATGINSIIGYNTNILLQSGLSDVQAHWGYVIFTVVNFLLTVGGLLLVAITGALFHRSERGQIDFRDALQSRITPGQTLTFQFDSGEAANLLATKGEAAAIDPGRAYLVVVYAYGGFTAETNVARSEDKAAPPIQVTRESCVPANKIEAFFKNPFASLDTARTAPLRIEKALVGQVPAPRNGWLIAICLYVFTAFYAVGPGVCVWLALSELMPTRIRSNGMSIALVINQVVSTTLAAIFLPIVSNYGYSTIFFLFAGFTVIYFVTAVFFLPETKGKTLEEIEEHFEKAGNKAGIAAATSPDGG